MKVKIYGAGSIGNHLAQASRRMGWDVVVVDHDAAALTRMKESIYPSRYGAWDGKIELYLSGEEPKGGFDLICLGTPPDVRMPLALMALQESPRAILLEKPVCPPSSEGLFEFLRELNEKGVLGFVGYDHAVSDSVAFVRSILKQEALGKILTLDVEFRENWEGIFKAHPWLAGPADTYLGFTERGGGASGEHSHALHLWYTFATAAGLGGWSAASGELHMVEKDGAYFDDVAAFTLKTGTGILGRVVQDVVTKPTRKWARVQGDNGFIEWYCNGAPDADVVRFKIGETPEDEKLFHKKRPDDFYAEMRHIDAVLKGGISHEESPIALKSGVEVMKVLQSAQKSGTLRAL